MSRLELAVLAYCAGVFTLPAVVYGVCRYDRWRAGRSSE